MHRKIRTILLACILLALVAWPALAGKRMTIEDALAFLNVGNPQLSADGQQIAYTLSEWNKKDNNRISHIYVVSTGGGTPVRFTNGEKGESNPQWSPDGKWLAFTASRDKEKKGSQIYLISATGGEAEQLTELENGVTGFRWSPDSKRIAYITRDEYPDKKEREKKIKDKFDGVIVDQDLLYSHLWVIEVGSKKATRLTEGNFSVADPQWSSDGAWIAYTQNFNHYQPSNYHDISANRNSDIWVVSATDKTQKHRLTSGEGQDSSPRWSPNGKWIAFVSAGDSKSWASKSDIHIVSAQGGRSRNITSDQPDSTGSDLTWSPDGKWLYYIDGTGVYSRLVKITPEGGKPVEVISGKWLISGFDLAADGKACTYVRQDSLHSGEIYASPTSGGEARQLTTANPGLAEFDLGRSQVINWKGSQNLTVEGILTYPLGYQEGKTYPLILQIHGGPYGRFVDNFDSRGQIFAANGYAILRPNPRGSTGYGYPFTVANVANWGGDDFKDIMAGVDKAIEMGVVNPNQLVVMGGSYGGFMTYWTVTQTDRFKAAIAHAGITDWYSFHGQSDIPGLMEYGFTGVPWEVEGIYRKWSPMTYVQNVKTPILSTHGEEDRRVPIAQAEQFYTAVRKRGVEIVFLRFPREGHGIQEPNHQIDLVGRQLDWFDRHLGIKRSATETTSAK